MAVSSSADKVTRQCGAASQHRPPPEQPFDLFLPPFLGNSQLVQALEPKPKRKPSSKKPFVFLGLLQVVPEGKTPAALVGRLLLTAWSLSNEDLCLLELARSRVTVPVLLWLLPLPMAACMQL